MASDNTTLNSGSGGDTIRAVAKTANSPAKTQIVVLDVGGGADGSAETALAAGQKASASSLSFVPASDLASVEPAGSAIAGASMPSGGAGLTGWLSAIWKTLQSGVARAWTLSSATDSVAATISNASLAVTGTFWPATQPVSLAALPSLASGSNTIGSIANTSFAATQATASSLNATVVGTGTFAVQAAQSGAWSAGRTWTLGSGTDSVAATISGAERWVAGSGQGLAWGSAFGSEINSIVSGNAILSSVVIANGTALDTYMDVSAAIGSITTTSGAPYLGLYLYPLNQDGSTYGDGRFASSAAGPPLSNYFVGQIPLIPSVTQAQEGAATGIVIPPGSFALALYNLAGATLASSGNTIRYRTYNRAMR